MAWASPLRVGHGQITVGCSSPGSSPFLVVDEQEMGLAGVLSNTEARRLPLEAEHLLPAAGQRWGCWDRAQRLQMNMKIYLDLT